MRKEAEKRKRVRYTCGKEAKNEIILPSFLTRSKCTVRKSCLAHQSKLHEKMPALAFSALAELHCLLALTFSYLARNLGISCPALRAIFTSAGLQGLS